ncbi:MAG: diguanylate cyclase [Acidobacteriaceae bacterium]|nr:diguanylate cyclase [Acidobacteriaceae bacterium]
MAKKLLYHDQDASRDSLLDSAYEVATADDIPPFGLESPKYLVFLHAGVRELRLTLTTTERRTLFHLEPGAICFLPLWPSARFQWTGSTKVFILVVDAAALQALAQRHRLTEIDFDQCYLIQDRDARNLGELVTNRLRKAPQDPSYIDAVARGFFVHLMHQFGEESLVQARLSLPSNSLDQVIEYAHEHLLEDLPVSSLARLTGLGERQFSRRFRISTGMSPCQWILHKRLELAAVLLRDQNLSIAEIAFRTKFADQSHFTRSFHRLFKKTPKVYRSLVSVEQAEKARREESAPPARVRTLTNSSESQAVKPHEINFQVLSEANADIIAMIGPDWIIHYISPSCLRVLGWKPPEMKGKSIADFILEEDLLIAEARHHGHVDAGVEEDIACIRMRKKCGAYAWMEIHARVLKEESQTKMAYILLTLRDITRRKERERELERMAYFDELTGLPNLRSLMTQLEKQWQQAAADKKQISMVLFDVDHFKEYNEWNGRLAGDDCFSRITKTVCKIIDCSQITVARCEEDKVAIVLPGVGSRQTGHVAERIRSAVEALQLPHRGNPSGKNVITVSVGHSTADPLLKGLANGPKELMHRSQLALADAKLSGRNRVVTLDGAQTYDCELPAPEEDLSGKEVDGTEADSPGSV